MNKFTFPDMPYQTYISPTIVGDVHVDVNIKFEPRFKSLDVKEEIGIESVNMRLAMISGEVKRVVEQQVRDMINQATVDYTKSNLIKGEK